MSEDLEELDRTVRLRDRAIDRFSQEKIVIKFRRAQDKYAARIKELTAKLVAIGKCPHRDAYWTTWEWDNGYGRQEWKDQVVCSTCGQKDSWPMMNGSSALVLAAGPKKEMR